MPEKHDIVQVIKKKHPWHLYLVIVDKIKKWGIQGYISNSVDDGKMNKNTYVNLMNEEFRRVGKVINI